MHLKTIYKNDLSPCWILFEVNLGLWCYPIILQNKGWFPIPYESTHSIWHIHDWFHYASAPPRCKLLVFVPSTFTKPLVKVFGFEYFAISKLSFVSIHHACLNSCALFKDCRTLRPKPPQDLSFSKSARYTSRKTTICVPWFASHRHGSDAKNLFASHMKKSATHIMCELAPG